MTFGLYLFPLTRRSGKTVATQPGLYVAAPPQRPTRSRSGDRLVLFLTLMGNASLPQEQQTQLLARLSQIFYGTAGSVTAAMRTVAEHLNQYLLQRNVRSAGHGQQAIGWLTQVVLRGDRIYLAQSGPTHVYHLNPQRSKHLHDPEITERGLGSARATDVRYSQIDLQVGDFLLLTPKPAPNWQVNTLHETKGLEGLRRRLVAQSPADLDGVLIQIREGRNEVRLFSPGQLEERTDLRTKETSRVVEPAQTGLPTRQAGRVSRLIAEPPSKISSSAEKPRPAHPEEGQPVKSVVESWRSRLKHASQVVFTALGRVMQSLRRGLGTMLERVLPDSSVAVLPSSIMAGIAIVVPLILVTIAGVLYFERGKEQQYQQYFSQAQAVAVQVNNVEDPITLHAAWELTLYYLEKAEEYRTTAESTALKQQAQNALDALDGIERIVFQPAIAGGLGSEVQITRMVATQDDLYLLDGAQGEVWRALRTGKGYEMAPNFVCAPRGNVGPLVDLMVWPRGSEPFANIVAMDSSGHLLYCFNDKNSMDQTLEPPDSGWSTPTALTADVTELYILDPGTNAVWSYDIFNVESRIEPRLFFSEQIPPMKDVVDIAIHQDELFLLHQDGLITICQYSYDSDEERMTTICTEPATYTDTRPGRDGGVVIADTRFTQILFSGPPDPSLYLLDSKNQALYRFSVRLVFQEQFQSQTDLPETLPTAFTVDPSRNVFLALGNVVYYATLP
ncbi:MAG: hypothetical protein AB1345_14790 [Chloroflexota bacterium]